MCDVRGREIERKIDIDSELVFFCIFMFYIILFIILFAHKSGTPSRGFSNQSIKLHSIRENLPTR